MNEVKHKSISSILEKNIRNNTYKHKLPTVRFLSSEFSVSTRTLNKALKPLVQKGLVIPGGPQGNLINSNKSIRPKTNIVGIFCCGASPDFQNDPLLKELKLKVEEDGCKAIFMNSPGTNDFEDEKFWTSSWIDGYIFVYSTINKELAYLLSKNNVPFVVANRLPAECGAHWVDFNLEKSMQTMVEYLADIGRRNIMLAFSRIHLPSYVEYIKNTWKTISRNYSAQTISEPLYIPGKNANKKIETCVEYFLTNNADAVVLIRISPTGIRARLSETGKQINTDYSMVYNSYEIEDSAENIPCMFVPYSKLADETWELFKKIIINPDLEIQNLLVDEDLVLTK
ncbi:MAG: GntR family transcriptional regulator [Victivallaceae bacterium]